MGLLREEYVEVDTHIRCPHCGEQAWFPRPSALAAAIVCPMGGCENTFVWDRWVSRELGIDRFAYLHPRVPGLFESMTQRSWEIVGLGICTLVFAVPLIHAGLHSAVTKLFAYVYFAGMGLAALGLGVAQRRGNRLRAAHRAQTRAHVLERSPTIRAVQAAGWVPEQMLVAPTNTGTGSRRLAGSPPA